MTVLSLPSLKQPADLLRAQRDFFATGQTRPYSFRLAQLKKLKAAIEENQAAIVKAVKEDLGRPDFEGYFEIGAVIELNYVIKRLKRWMKPRRAQLPLAQLPGSAWVQPEPLGCVLIIGPWNYPFQLLISPLLGAIAAGNCAILKPSEQAPATSKVVAELIAATFNTAYAAVVEGDGAVAQELLTHKFDHILFTGGQRVGQQVMAAAAQQLTPVTLELGGKNPCLVDQETNLELTARRIVWGKFINAGQTCVAPDYLLVHEAIESALLAAIKAALEKSFGPDPSRSSDFARVINAHHFDRVVSLIAAEETAEAIFVGGQSDRGQRYIAPTVLSGVSWEAPVMQEEIFGPVLPVLTYGRIEDAIAQINARPKPLALYCFSHDKALQAKVLAETSSGSVCLNDVFLQFSIWDLPFGGVGSSGIGAYHGKTSFDTFSHAKSILRKPFWIDLNWRYPPYGNKLEIFKKALPFL